jgi:hypothetical protein
VAGISESANKILGSIKCREFLDLVPIGFSMLNAPVCVLIKIFVIFFSFGTFQTLVILVAH